MRRLTTIKESYNSLDEVLNFVKKQNVYKCSKTWDIWKIPSDGEMNECILIKKNNLYGVKVNLKENNILQIQSIIPNKFLINFATGRGLLTPIVRKLLASGQKQLIREQYEIIKKISE